MYMDKAQKDEPARESDNISAATLEDMDKSISNFKMGEVSKPIDLSDF